MFKLIKLHEIWKKLHRENADPLELPESIRKGVWDMRAKEFLPFAEGKEVLELGCGYGYNAFLFSKEAERVLGLDIDGETIKKARRNYQGIQNLNFIKEDALSFLEKTEESFDIVILLEFIEHIEVSKQKALIERIAKVSRPKGELFISMPNGKFVPFYRKNPYHKHEMGVKELLGLISKHFKIEEIKGQISLFWFFIPLPWAWLEKLWIKLGIYEKIHQIRNNPENSRTILLRARKIS